MTAQFNTIDSLQVPPESIGRYDQVAKAMMADLATAIDSGGATEEKIATLVGEMVGAMPEALKEEIRDINQFKGEMGQAINNFCRRFSGENAPTENDLHNLVALMMSIAVRHQVFSLNNNRVLDGEQLPAGFNPKIAAEYLSKYIPINSINTQKGLGLLVWMASFYTSWQGLTHYIGEYGIQMFTNVTGMKVAPNVAYWARTVSAIGISGAISQIVQLWKSDIEKRSQENNMPGFKAARESQADFRKKRPALWAMAALAVLFDIGTNFNGVITAAGQRKELTAQVEDAQGEIQGRVDAIKDHLEKLDAIPAATSTTVSEILTKEEKGDSETGVGGLGTIYHAKNAVLTEDGASLGALKGTDFKNAIGEAVRNSGLIDGASLPQELEGKVEDASNQIIEITKQIEAKSAALDPMQEPEALQADVDEVVQLIEEALIIVNDDLPDDINSHTEKYDALSRELVRIAQTLGGKAYDNIQPDKLQSLKVEGLKMENSQITLEEIHYVGFEDIIRVMREQYTPLTGSLLLLVAAILAYFNSYLDLHTLPWTRRAYQKDMAEADEKRRKFLDVQEEKLIQVLLKVLNEGPFSKYFNEKESHHPESIRQILNGLIGELSERRKTTRSKMWAVLPIGPGEGDDYRGLTEVAQAHNARVRAVQQILGDDKKVQELLGRVLPGLRVLENPKPGETVTSTRALNDQTIEARNTEIQNTELGKVLIVSNGCVQFLRTASFPTSTEWERTQSTYKDLEQKFAAISSIYPANQNKAIEVKAGLEQLNSVLSQTLPKILLRELNTLDLKNSTPDEALVDIEKRIKRLQAITNTTTPVNADDTLELEKTIKKMEEILQQIRTIRDGRAKTHDEQQRLLTQKVILENAEKAIRPLTEWKKWRSGTDTDRKKAEDLAAAFGENNMHLAPTTQLNDREKARLRAAHNNAETAFSLLIPLLESDPERKASLEDLQRAMADDFAILSRFL